MITIVKATIQDIPKIQEIAQKTWPETYGDILSNAQFEYMMKMMYSDESLIQQFQKNHLFFIENDGNNSLGFISIENNYLNTMVTRIHKIYILPEAQGKGIGKLLIEKVQEIAKENQSKLLSLNVNKYNKAFTFYQKLGFEIVGQEDLEIGNGYLMEDYKMELRI